MKKLQMTAAAAVVAMLIACGGQNEKIESERDSLLMAQQAQQELINDMYGTLGEFSLTLDSIAANDGLLTFRSPEGRLLTKEQIRANLSSYKKLLEDSKAKIAELQEKLQGNTTQLEKLQGMINFLQKELDSKEKTINQLLAELDKKNADIAKLSKNVQELTETKDSLAASLDNTKKTLDVAESVYYIVGNKNTFEKLGFYISGDIRRKASIDNKKLNPEGFNKSKVGDVTTISISGKKPLVMTGQPAGSYELKSASKTEHTLVITDPAAFWSTTRYLVVRVE
jgi:uncharacterized protein YoxC